jgi:hypothetical protein
MAYDPDNQVLRLPKKHAPGIGAPPDPELGRRLEAAQSPRNAVTGGLIAVVLFTVAWVLLTSLTGRVFPWLSVVGGFAVGNVVRYAGKGLDWRFPALAAILALVCALLGNVALSAAYTAGEFDTSTIRILSKATRMTWPVFFAEVLTAADYVYAGIGALVAAYYANRRLDRREYFALRQWRDGGRAE